MIVLIDVSSRDCNATDAHVSYGKLSKGTSGGASNLLAQEDLELIWGVSSLEYTSQVLWCEGSHIVICKYDDLYGVQGIEDDVRVWISQKE